MGRINFGRGCGIIRLSDNIKVEGQWRFTIAHEMGHFYNEKKKETFCRAADLIGARSNKAEEDDANDFAAEFLMKKEWFAGFVKDKTPSIETIKEAADYFNVSLSAAAIRYSQAGTFPVAVIMSRNGKVSWSAISESFPYQYIRKGRAVNSASKAHAFFAGKETDPEPHEVPADSWFPGDKNLRTKHRLVEECLPMPNYKSVLTIIREQP